MEKYENSTGNLFDKDDWKCTVFGLSLVCEIHCFFILNQVNPNEHSAKRMTKRIFLYVKKRNLKYVLLGFCQIASEIREQSLKI